MRRLIAILAAAAMLLSSVSAVGAADAQRLAKGQRIVTSVSRNVVQGGRAWMTVKITRCDRTQIKNFAITAATDLTSGTVTLNRVGVVRNAGSRARACVWRASFKVADNASLGAHTVSFTVAGSGVGAATLANPTRTITVRAPEASAGTSHSSGN